MGRNRQMPRWAKKRDKTEGPIVAALRQVGATVILIDEPVDAIVLFRGVTYLCDFKSKGGTLTENQKKLQEDYQGGPLGFVYSEDEALRFIGAVE